MTRKRKTRTSDPAALQKLVDQYEQVFGEVATFIELIARQEAAVGEAQQATYAAKEKYEHAKSELSAAREARDGTKHALFMFLVFGEVATTFIELIARQEAAVGEAQQATYAAKEKYEHAKSELSAAREARDGTKHALFMFLRPGPAEILPLFDRMAPADEQQHGAHADEWRKEPISALTLSLVATNLLSAADILFVGQLQDRVLAQPRAWWSDIEGLTEPMALAVADRLNDFIEERAGK